VARAWPFYAFVGTIIKLIHYRKMASHPALEDWFSTSIRRNRKSFMLAAVALVAFLLGVVLVIGWFNPSRRTAMLVLSPFLIAGVVCTYFLAAQRIRDMGMTGWLALLQIPINMADAYLHGAASLAALIVLCTVPGTQGPNRYGPDPLGGQITSHRIVATDTSGGANMRRSMGSIVEAAGGTAFFGLYVFGFAGWAYWMWLAIKFGSFLMFFLGLFGPLALIAALLGMWSMVFGVPDWLTNLVT
jgi:uncharacterized membrane protein YhaH (DUF805 family)